MLQNGGRIGLRGGDAARADRAARSEGRASMGRADERGGVDDRSTRGQTAVNEAAIMMARMQNQNKDRMTNPRFIEKFPTTSPVFANFDKMAIDKMIAENLDDDEENQTITAGAGINVSDVRTDPLASFIRNMPEFKQKISDTVSGIMANPDIANLGKTGFAEGGRIGLRGGGADMGGVAGASRGPAGGQTRGDFASDRGRDPTAQFKNTASISEQAIDALKAQRNRARGEITPSTRFGNRLFSTLLNTYVPFSGSLFNRFVDKRAMGFSPPKRERIDQLTIEDDRDEKDFNSQAIATLFTPYQKDVLQEKLRPVQLAIQERDDMMGGARLFAAEGGIMNLEQAREGYKLGKLVKKITRSVKKIAKSPVGKAALLYGGYQLGKMPIGDGGSLFDRGASFFRNMEGGDRLGLAAAAGLVAAPFLFKEEEEDQPDFGEGPKLPAPIKDIRANYRNYLAPAFLAEGGKPEPVAKKTMPLLDMGGKEMDLRDEGGFVPIGRMEKADDVPARLSKNEFVFTADAVRNAGDGNVDKGAEVMYNMMKNLEAGGEVSEESQGLEGARKMFQTSQRLGEVI